MTLGAIGLSSFKLKNGSITDIKLQLFQPMSKYIAMTCLQTLPLGLLHPVTGFSLPTSTVVLGSIVGARIASDMCRENNNTN